MSAKKSSKKLTKKELDEYKEQLIKLKNEFLHDIKNLADDSNQNSDSGDVSGHVLHMADVATDMYDKEFSMGLASKDREVLNKIEEALKRIQDGTFGLCLATEKAISKARLKAIPYAEYCLEYQEELESKKGPNA